MRRLPSPIALFCALALAVAATLATPRAARATLMEALDLATLVARSDDVVVARASEKSCRWMGERIVTDVVLEVSEVAKGDLGEGERLEVLLLGGAVGELGMRVSGEAGLEPGGEYLLFLRRWNGTRRPVGMAQGALPVQRSGGTVVVEPARGDLALVRRGPGGTLTHAEPAVTEARPLADLLAAIRDLQ